MRLRFSQRALVTPVRTAVTISSSQREIVRASVATAPGNPGKPGDAAPQRHLVSFPLTNLLGPPNPAAVTQNQ
jgi:hypothetical protein